MSDVLVFAIDNYKYKVKVIKIVYKGSPLDGAGTGRTEAVGAPLVREPIGFFENFSVTFGADSSLNTDYLKLIQDLKSFGTKDFRVVTVYTPFGAIEQEMYSSGFEIEAKRVDKQTGESYWAQFTVNFIAKEGK